MGEDERNVWQKCHGLFKDTLHEFGVTGWENNKKKIRNIHIPLEQKLQRVSGLCPSSGIPNTRILVFRIPDDGQT
jgi:hypothetical protein